MTSTDEKKTKCEKELFDFVTKRIKNVGGSLQFQHLTSLLPQLSFETRNAVGSNKVQLMKYLKSHPKHFNVDSKGIVTVVDSLTTEEAPKSGIEHNVKETGNLLPPFIEKGEGRISKIHAEFGFIKGIEPFETIVYFKASEFGDKDCLLTDFDDLCVGREVGFNAVKGHNDSYAKYCATKVWLRYQNKNGEDIESNATSRNSDTTVQNSNNTQKLQEGNERNGEGIIQKVFKTFGYISINGERKNSVYFHNNNLEEYDNVDDLTNVLNVGDCVEFTAIENKRKDLPAQWQAVNVWIKSKSKKQNKKDNFANSDSEDANIYNNKISYSGAAHKNMQTDVMNKNDKTEMIKGVVGKISPHKKSANILFGKNFMSIANGDSSAYFLYGAQVTEIEWEFSDGDDVIFDAVKIKSDPGWRAVLVWVGERPDHAPSTWHRDCGNESANEELDETHPEESYQSRSSSQSFKACNSSETFGNTKHESKYLKTGFTYDTEQVKKKTSKPCDYSVMSTNEFREHKKHNFESPNKKTQSSKVYNKQSKQIKESKWKDSPYKLKDEQKPRKKNQLSEYHQSNDEFLSNDDNFSTASENSTQEYVLGSKEFDRKCINQQKRHFLTPVKPPEVEDVTKHEIVPEPIKKTYGEASIKMYKGIDCKLSKVLCKFACGSSPYLTNPVTFFSNTFYNNGLSVEEQQLDDLREVISRGDTVKLNCFEIVDDSGKIHNKVTMACIGQEPEISEITPEDFIAENNLTVTINDNSSAQDVQTDKSTCRKFLNVVSDSDSDDKIEASASPSTVSSFINMTEMTPRDFQAQNELNVSTNYKSNNQDVQRKKYALKKILSSSSCSDSDEKIEKSLSLSRSSSSGDISDDETSLSLKYSKISETCQDRLFERKAKSTVDYNVFSEMISQKLKSKGLLFDSEVNLNGLSTEIVDLIVLKHQNIKSSGSNVVNQRSDGENCVPRSSVCSRCAQAFCGEASNQKSSLKHKEIQTIVTGDVVATSIFTEL